jgi:hypothetical protein
MNLDDTPKVNYTKEEIERIVEDKIRSILQVHEHHKALLGVEFSEMADNIVKTEAGIRHTKKKVESRPIIKAFPNKKQLLRWLFENTPKSAVSRYNLDKLEIEEQEDGTYIVY